MDTIEKGSCENMVLLYMATFAVSRFGPTKAHQHYPGTHPGNLTICKSITAEVRNTALHKSRPSFQLLIPQKILQHGIPCPVQRFVHGEDTQGGARGQGQDVTVVLAVEKQAEHVPGFQIQAGPGQKKGSFRFRKLKDEFKCQRRAAAPDDRVAEGADFLPGDLAAPFRLLSLRRFGVVKFRMKLPVDGECGECSDRSLRNQETVEGILEQQLIHKISNMFYLECNHILQPAFLSEEPDFSPDDQEADGNENKIGKRMRQLRHMGEIHAIPARQQRKRQEDRGDDGQKPHGVILL